MFPRNLAALVDNPCYNVDQTLAITNNNAEERRKKKEKARYINKSVKSLSEKVPHLPSLSLSHPPGKSVAFIEKTWPEFCLSSSNKSPARFSGNV
jgi:hypothetical protein